MRFTHLRTTTAVLVLVASGSLTLAQQAPPPEPQQQRQQEQWQHTPSGKHGKEEPSSHAPTSQPPAGAVLIDGALNAPGAPADNQTVPAKFSEKNATTDKLIIADYVLRSLSDDDRRAIYQGLKGRAPASSFNAEVGTQLPLMIELHPLPNNLAIDVPRIKDYRYTVAHDRVLLVSPLNRTVVGAFGEGGGTEATVGKR